jgi:hypothetical protein
MDDLVWRETEAARRGTLSPDHERRKEKTTVECESPVQTASSRSHIKERRNGVQARGYRGESKRRVIDLGYDYHQSQAKIRAGAADPRARGLPKKPDRQEMAC